MDTQAVVGLVKSRLGIMTAVRDTYLTAIVNGILKELADEQGVVLADDNPAHLIFVADYATWRYQSVGDAKTTSTSIPLSMPRHLQFRLHNLIIHATPVEDDEA